MRDDLKRLVRKTLHTLSALPEERMRLDLLGRTLSRLEPFDIARFIDALYGTRPRSGAAALAQGLLVNPEGLKRAIGTDKYRRTYLASIHLGLTKVSRLFTDLPPYKKGLAGYDKEEEVRMEHLTLGQRRALSRTGKKDDLDRLLSDPDPVVIGNLLDNPRLMERDVLKIASRRPGSPAIMKVLAGHRKWSKRYPVRRALAANPYTPPRIAIALLEFLMARDLKEISADDTLHPQVRLSAGERLGERGESGDEG